MRRKDSRRSMGAAGLSCNLSILIQTSIVFALAIAAHTNGQQQTPGVQQPGVPHEKTSNSSAPSPAATAPITTQNPLKLATVMPELDFNKELLDYNDALLASLKFRHPTQDTTGSDPLASLNYEDFERKLINRYHDHDELYAYLHELAQAYPKIARLYDVGASVESRKLWVFEISDRPGRHEPLRPDVRYIANMHGNEAVGRELLLHLARLILENYEPTNSKSEASGQTTANSPTGQSFIRKLVRSTRIHLMPTMNPDGFVRSDVGCKYEAPSRRGRLNARNVDLNRNFPDKFLGTKEDAGTQAEVRALMDWSRREPFVLSANLHGGAVVASIPYDAAPDLATHKQQAASATAAASASLVESQSPSAGYVSSEFKSPDQAIFMELARAYTRSHPTMWRGEMCYDKCTEYHTELFPNEGITTGSGWYVLNGGMQDWMYENTNDFHITLEIGCNQYPPAEALHQYWQFNKVPLLNYMRQVHRGIKGMIEDETTLKPISLVNVHVRTIDHNVTSTQAGDYFRLLAPGEYNVLFEHANYQPVEIFVALKDTMAQIHHIKMKPRIETQTSTSNNASSALPNKNKNTNTNQANGQEEEKTTTDDSSSKSDNDDNTHSIVVATLVMTVIIIVLLLMLAATYVIQKRRFTRSQSVELQPTGRPFGSSTTMGGGGGGGGGGGSSTSRTSLSPNVVSA